MATKHVILANNSRLLREMLQRVINKTDNLEVVQELLDPEELPAAIEQFEPEWVILSLPCNNNAHSGLNACMSGHPSVRFILLSPENSSVKMKWQTVYEEDLTNLSVNDFIRVLEKNLQHNEFHQKI